MGAKMYRCVSMVTTLANDIEQVEVHDTVMLSSTGTVASSLLPSAADKRGDETRMRRKNVYNPHLRISIDLLLSLSSSFLFATKVLTDIETVPSTLLRWCRLTILASETRQLQCK